MEDIFQSSENIVHQNYKIGESYKVNVTFINNPYSFYIQPYGFKYFRTLEKPGKPVQNNDLKLGSIVVYKSQTSNKYVRGNIIAFNEFDRLAFNIFAIDYGYIDKCVDIHVIYKSKTSKYVAPLAKHCQLANCEPLGSTFTDDVTEAMKIFIRNQHCLMKVNGYQSDGMLVTLINTGADDIAKLLCMTFHTYFGVCMNMSISRITSTQIPNSTISIKSFKADDVLHICTLRANLLIPNTFYVACVDDYRNYTKSCTNFTNYCEYQSKVTRESLQVGKLVGYKSQFAIHYQRAVTKCILDTGDKALIFLIDCGETKEASINQLKEIQCSQYFETPGIAFQCTFQYDVRATKELVQYPKPGYEMWIKINEIGDPNIVEIVVQPNSV